MLQSYVISEATMRRWQNLTYVKGITPPIDVYLSSVSSSKELAVSRR
jgi:hypothetical protein